ncbi:uncharacterized protein AMSG_00582 [Thecamonas trahens ATCC 50062]|uniref:RING-type domain-containing protein n=1 Tax=Thecamonas trahens ATCC 50062 TaxID=461836 RepID=A0A0L0D8U6_THETB|nr:hypothetical protein AMSG_00582 [Thecamonas trahens ATCC 50062]KNC48802.1 hypothetical protein AMSG_00582 [Thecamonas trahens ATCC 50062]|eukprot:XP_013762853.1 hypothetical protein AMSG_00582 [Thecamonas trahens ATCC 50062]
MTETAETPDFSNWDAAQWAEACSICFSANCEIALPECGDQFCGGCLGKYFHAKIESSWGLRAQQLDCPVCHVPVDEETWTGFVDDDHATAYHSFQAARDRGVERFCPAHDCGGRLIISMVPTSEAEREAVLRTTRREMRAAGVTAEAMAAMGAAAASFRDLPEHATAALDAAVASYFAAFDDGLSGSTLTAEAKARISSAIIGQPSSPEVRRALELGHLVRFPRALCRACGRPACSHCGSAWHEGETCEAAAERIAAELADAPETDAAAAAARSLAFVLASSKRCPHCSVFVQRDDGCNRMSCVVCCGPTWCWVCGRTSAECTFYACAINGPNPEAAPHALAAAPPELGVPDVTSDAFASFTSPEAPPAAPSTTVDAADIVAALAMPLSSAIVPDIDEAELEAELQALEAEMLT